MQNYCIYILLISLNFYLAKLDMYAVERRSSSYSDVYHFVKQPGVNEPANRLNLFRLKCRNRVQLL